MKRNAAKDSVLEAIGVRLRGGFLRGRFAGSVRARVLAALPALLFCATACGPVVSREAHNAGTGSLSTSSSVDLPVTPVDDQGKIGFCWAYGTLGLVESVFKSKNGVDVNLSEEALGFYRLAYHLHKLIVDAPDGGELLTNLSRGLNEGFYTRLPESQRLAGELDALDLIQKHGVVPESAWSQKFPDAVARDGLMAALRTNALRLLAHKPRTQVTLEDVMNSVMVGSGAFESRPPTSFAWQGQTVEATAFLTDVLGFHSDAFVAVEARSEAELEMLVSVTKRSLARGFAVPIGYPINVSRLSGITFGADGADLNNGVDFAKDGGHLVLATDFVNEGGTEGKVPPEVLAAEVAKPASALSYFRVKNSWGLGEKKDASGKILSSSSDGYYRITRDYLIGSVRAASKGWMATVVVVPRDVLNASESSGANAARSEVRTKEGGAL